MNVSNEYEVFISYESSTKSIAESIEQLLNDNNISAFRDDTAIKWGDNIIATIARGLSQSKGYLLILNNAFFNKGWTMHEWWAAFNFFIKGRGDTERFMFALLLDEKAREEWESFAFSQFISAVNWNDDNERAKELINAIKIKLGSNAK